MLLPPVAAHGDREGREENERYREARDRHLEAVDNYNKLVDRYSAAPVTISQPVLAAYAFRQGNVEQGWRLSGTMAVTGRKATTISGAAIETDFVRLGARVDDVKADQRTDNKLDLDTSREHLQRLLGKAAGQMVDRMAQALITLPLPQSDALESEDRQVLSWLLHPFGRRGDLAGAIGVPPWAVEAAEKLP